MIDYDGKCFSEALKYLKEGHKVTRAAWPENMFIAIKKPIGKPDNPNCSEMTHRYLYMQRPKGGRVPWFAGNFDILADDYIILEKTVTSSDISNFEQKSICKND
jgi:hypothetical protein